MLVSKIVSGGQTGVDRGAIEAALENGFPYGGLIPKGRLAEDGIVPLKFDRMKEAPRKDYLFRTEWNVTHSDATLIIARYNTAPSVCRESLTGGTLKTELFCRSQCKSTLIVYTANIEKVVCWLKGVASNLGHDVLMLNVAGPRESKARGIQETAKVFVSRLIKRVKEDVAKEKKEKEDLERRVREKGGGCYGRPVLGNEGFIP